MPLKRFFHKIRIYKLLLKASLKKALFNAFYSALIVFCGTLVAQLQNTQQITIITVITAFLTATVTFLVELRENYPFFKVLLQYKTKGKNVMQTLKLIRLMVNTRLLSVND
jgi:uncharacterized protein involved in response to NO